MAINIDIINQRFPLFSEPELKQEIAEKGICKKIKKNESLLDVGSYIRSIPLVTNGKIKVFREDEEANELLLYYLYPGEACAVSLVCTMGNKKSKVKAVALEDSEIVMIPVDLMEQFIRKYRSWYQFVIRTYNDRIDELLETIDSIAFHKMDERLIEYLEKATDATESNIIKGTHQTIAYELNTSREVVSRLLKQLEKKGLVKLSRNQIELIG